MPESQAAYRIQILRGSEHANNIYTGPEGEITIDMTNKRVRIHDGVRVGGHPLGSLQDISTVRNELMTMIDDLSLSGGDGSDPVDQGELGDPDSGDLTDILTRLDALEAQLITPPENGKSAYEIAVDAGFTGTETEWLESLKGEDGVIGADGADGQSAYEIALEQGFTGTETEWLESLKGEGVEASTEGSIATVLRWADDIGESLGSVAQSEDIAIPVRAYCAYGNEHVLYSLTESTLPAGLSLGEQGPNGVMLRGTTPSVAESTEYTFTLNATMGSDTITQATLLTVTP